MNQLQLSLLAAVAITLALPAPVRTATEISEKERAAIVQHLTTTRDQVLAEAAQLSEAQWTFKAAPDRWSVGEVVQHLALAETFIFDLQQKAMSGAPATPEQLAAAKGKDEMIRTVIPDRTKKVQAPEPLQPATSKMGGQAEVVAAFRERRGKTIEYAAKTKDDLRARVSDSALGPLDAYQWLIFAAAHSERHLAQIKEAKADPKFPKTAGN